MTCLMSSRKSSMLLCSGERGGGGSSKEVSRLPMVVDGQSMYQWEQHADSSQARHSAFSRSRDGQVSSCPLFLNHVPDNLKRHKPTCVAGNCRS